MKMYRILVGGDDPPVLRGVEQPTIVRGEGTAVMLRNALRENGYPEAMYDFLGDRSEWTTSVHGSLDMEAAPQTEQFALVDGEQPQRFEEMTAKELRPIASAAGMKGARVAKKGELVAFLSQHS